MVVGEHDRRRPVAHAELAEDAARGSSVASATYNAPAISAFVAPRAISRRTSCSRSVSRSSRPRRGRRERLRGDSVRALGARPPGSNHAPTAGDRANSHDQVLRRAVLEHEPGGTASIAPHNTSSSPNVVRTSDPERIFDAAQERCCRDPVEGRHPDVHQNDVRVKGEAPPPPVARQHAPRRLRNRPQARGFAQGRLARWSGRRRGRRGSLPCSILKRKPATHPPPARRRPGGELPPSAVARSFIPAIRIRVVLGH